MSSLESKIRRLSLPERKKLAEKGIYISDITPQNEQQAILEILSLIYSDKELAGISTFEEESELTTKIIEKTYGLTEQEAKN